MAKRMDVKDLNLFYGKFHAVADVHLSVPPRGVTAFIGPSGCGKSTVLRSLNRMHEVTPGARVVGKVTLDGEDIYASAVDPVVVRRTIGMVFQRPNPFPTMSIRDNVVAGLRLSGVRDRKRLDEVAERALRSANLWEEVRDRLGKPGGGLSGGQQQRLCIARAIAVRPDVLLMDEPCSALDPISTLAIEDLIGELKKDYTIVIVTHNMQQAARVSDQTAFFNLRGRARRRPRTTSPAASADQVLVLELSTGGFIRSWPSSRSNSLDDGGPWPASVFFVGVWCRVLGYAVLHCPDPLIVVTVGIKAEQERLDRAVGRGNRSASASGPLGGGSGWVCPVALGASVRSALAPCAGLLALAGLVRQMSNWSEPGIRPVTTNTVRFATETAWSANRS